MLIIYNKAISPKIVNKKLRLGGISNFNKDLDYQKYANDIVVGYKFAPIYNEDPCFAMGEVYAFNIHLIEKHTGNITDGFHIPGREEFTDLGYDESDACRDPEDANFYHDFSGGKTVRGKKRRVSQLSNER